MGIYLKETIKQQRVPCPEGSIQHKGKTSGTGTELVPLATLAAEVKYIKH